ncbi:MAG: guanine deaminase [Pseudomonadota bacterium]
METALHFGQTLVFEADPAIAGLSAVRHDTHGALLVEDGHIAAVGPAETLLSAHPDTPRVNHGARLILPGFVDTHAHAAQTAIIASWAARLRDWLETHTFPEETRFGDPVYAAEIAERYLDLCLSFGTTTAASYCTAHPASVDALMTAAEARGLRWIAGRVMMDRNAPDALCRAAEAQYDLCAPLIDRWQGRARLGCAITPRFAPTCSAPLLEVAGALARAHPDALIQTHLSEQPEEIAWVAELFPEARDYLDVYDRAGLLGPRTVLGHAIHLTDREWHGIAETGARIAHCPTSNTFLGSGLFDLARAQAAGIATGLATDVGGGSSFSMLRTMAAAFEIAQLRGHRPHPAELLWLATGGGAQVLGLGDKIGRLAPGFEADFVVLDLASTPAIATRSARAEDIWDAIFPTIMMGDDRAVAAVYAAGRRV